MSKEKSTAKSINPFAPVHIKRAAQVERENITIENLTSNGGEYGNHQLTRSTGAVDAVING